MSEKDKLFPNSFTPIKNIEPWDFCNDENNYSLGKEYNFMTYIVMNRNNCGVTIASDTTCNTPNGIVNIHKLFFDKQTKIIIGISGRSIVKQGNSLLHISKIFTDILPYYTKVDYPELLNHIIVNVQTYLNSIMTDNVETVHMLIVRFDKKITVEDYMASNKTKEIISKYTPLNNNSFSIGFVATDDNIKNRFKCNDLLSIDELKNTSISFVTEKINSNTSKEVEWVTMDNLGNIATNIS